MSRYASRPSCRPRSHASASGSRRAFASHHARASDSHFACCGIDRAIGLRRRRGRGHGGRTLSAAVQANAAREVFIRRRFLQPCFCIAINAAPTLPAAPAAIVGIVVIAIARSVVRTIVIAIRRTAVVVRIGACGSGTEREGSEADAPTPTAAPTHFGCRGFGRRLFHRATARGERQGHGRAYRAQGDRTGDAKREHVLHRGLVHDVVLSPLRSSLNGNEPQRGGTTWDNVYRYERFRNGVTEF